MFTVSARGATYGGGCGEAGLLADCGADAEALGTSSSSSSIIAKENFNFSSTYFFFITGIHRTVVTIHPYWKN